MFLIILLGFIDMPTNHSKRTFFIIAFCLVTLFLACGSMFAISHMFVEAELLPKRYAFIGGTAMLGLLMCFKTTLKMGLGMRLALVCFAAAYFSFRTLFSPLEQRDLSVACFASFLLLFACFNAMPRQWGKIFEEVIISVCIAQAIFGILHSSGLFPIRTSFKDAGSFDNPAGFAACLAAGFPFCLNRLNRHNHWQRWLSMAGLIIIPAGIILSESRTGILSVAIVAVIYLFARCGRMRKPLAIALIFAIIAILTIVLFFMRTGSSLGRLQIWQASLSMVGEHPLFGSGAGTFIANYMPHQASFFASDQSNGWRILADNVTHPFNEYLLILIEYGIVGLILLIIVAVNLIRNGGWKTTQGLCLIAIGVFALFSYPLRYPYVWLIIAYCVATINSGQYNTFRMPLIARLLIVILVSSLSGFTLLDAKFESKWGNLAHGLNLQEADETLKQYEKLYRNWNGNPYFLYNYGRVLGVSGNYDKSYHLLKHCSKYLNDYDVQMAMGDNCLQLEHAEKACHCYVLASEMCHNRFLPMHRLMRLYLDNGKEQKAMEMAKRISEAPVKIASPKISGIKHDAAEIIFKFSQQQTNITPKE